MVLVAEAVTAEAQAVLMAGFEGGRTVGWVWSFGLQEGLEELKGVGLKWACQKGVEMHTGVEQ